MKTITKFIFALSILALACGSIAFGQLPPVTPPDSAAKAAALGQPDGVPIDQMVDFNSGSRWHLKVNAMDKFGLVITDASFQKSPTEPFIYVLFDGRLGEIFVPYHDSSARYGDISDYTFKPLELDPNKFRAPGRNLMPSSNNKICKEVRQYLAWLHHEQVRYGQEVVYFSVLKAGNYDYIMEWTFRDDGAILVRAGSTGPKIECASESCGPDAKTAGHMHNFTWRLDIDLDGAGGDSAYLTRHVENFNPPPPRPLLGSTAKDKRFLISVEGGRVWNPEDFNTLVVEDSTLKNQNGTGRATSYELVPMRSGNARHSEDFTKKDFWVTRYNPEQILANGLTSYVSGGQSTVNQDIVVWYTGSEHHENNSRDEDRNTVPVLWTGFELIPNNLFDGTPFYQ